MAEPNLPANEQVPSEQEAYNPEDFFLDEQLKPTPETPVETPVETPPPPPEPVKHKHSRSLERRAIALGLSDEVIESMSSEELSAKLFEMYERQVAEGRSAALASDSRSQPGKKQAPTPEPEPPADPYAAFRLDPNAGWDEGFMKQHEAMLAHMKAQDEKINRLEGGVNQFHQSQAMTTQQQVEAFFRSQPDVYAPDGQLDEARCEAIVNALIGYKNRGQQTTLQQDLARAHKSLFGAISAPAEPKPNPALEQRKQEFREGAVTRPTQRNAVPLPKGREAAIAAARKYEAEHVMNGVAHDDDPTDTLP